jgi:hypothetical protein
MSDHHLNLPIPVGLRRQVGISDIGSPLTISRGSSIGSPRVLPDNQDEAMRCRLLAYKTFLEHDLDFVDSEISALLTRVHGANQQEETLLDELLDGLKVRHNTLHVRLTRTKALLEVM